MLSNDIYKENRNTTNTYEKSRETSKKYILIDILICGLVDQLLTRVRTCNRPFADPLL